MACGATLKRTMDFDPLLSPASPKRRRCAPMSPSPQKYLRMEPSPFGRLSSALTAEQILSNIKQEYKRMQKRRHLESSFQQTDSSCFPLDAPPHASSSSTGTLTGAARLGPLIESSAAMALRVVFAFPEQYDAFVKFTHDQLMRRFGEQPASYVS
ncbi:akirin-2 [Sinocyclocheilus grahami]|uniref:akirin-2 n=1 Tax=Sinocyclocheilus grahami TaxID=75366 RepID=UPI0007ACC870|nr:PREDICTED: akirin-2 [Sinocyclocheilus grahami]